MNGKRIECFDCTRALCMLFIVGIYHMNGYLKNPLFRPGDLSNFFVTGTLATFAFISGYFLGKKRIDGTRAALYFYRGRFVRLYPLFFLSAASLYAASRFISGYFSSFGQFILTLLGAACYVDMAPGTVWYVSMLLSFYLLTPLILRIGKGWIRITAAVSVYAVLAAAKYLNVLPIDNRIFLYYPLYFTGLICARSWEIGKKSSWIAAAVSAAALVGLYLVKRGILRNTAVAFFGTVLMIEAGKLCTRVRFLNGILKLISRASMAAYLFHRQFFGACELFFGKFSRLSAFLVLLPVCLACCYGVQEIYDRLAARLFKTRKAA